MGGRGTTMGLYSRVIFPRICDYLMSNPVMERYRKDLLACVGGELLEIGFGTGLNLPHYPEHIRRVTTVEPSAGMNRLAPRRIARSGISVVQRVLGGEELPFGDETFDWVVSTWTLCSIPEVGRAMGEVYRVLKPGGRLVFLEHGLSDNPGVQRWQGRLNWLQKHLAEGCRLDLDVEGVVKSQPFRDVDLARFVMERTPRTHGTMYRGMATK
jgi:SAM-dependent methyltransferase